MSRRMKKPIRASELKRHKELKKYEAEVSKNLDHIPLSRDLQENIKLVREVFGQSDDLVIRQIELGGVATLNAAVIFLDGLTDRNVIDEYILKSLMMDVQGKIPQESRQGSESLYFWVKEKGLNINEVGETPKLRKLVDSILGGDCGLLLDRVDQAILCNTKGWDKRGIEEPQTEAVVRGPREGFAETLRVNTALVRRRLKDPQLRVKNLQVGDRTNTDVCLMYIDGIVENNVLEEVKTRIEDIKIDGALESGYIEQFIEDHPWSPFPQIQNTERPDKVAASLLEGKVAILVDGTPFVLIVPCIFSQFYQSPEDYYERFIISSLIRVIRLISMFIALLLPALYIAFSSFHPEMIPSKLAIAMTAGRSTVPFPSIVEALLMEVSIEILREASIRLPGPIGPTIGIVGALVVGQAAVQAGIVSPIMVIVVALTTIGSFVSPGYNAAIALRMLRFPLMLAASMFGLYGIMLLLIVTIVHLCSMKSFGVPYMAPFSPMRILDNRDTLLRAPLYRMKFRPSPFEPQDENRMDGRQSNNKKDGQG
ncbi:spore germination protein [Caldalkalibacillus salinus]|uniref:spore germination protein n=1 Tax=Caldalkalibacillus salinus TaxID=2803787 RepID=UPI001924BA4E|nr:spore germination protein [Caldalkalibacillus salinus]